MFREEEEKEERDGSSCGMVDATLGLRRTTIVLLVIMLG
jgi:hypothetical protein